MSKEDRPVPYYPVMLRLEGRRCVVVGGGTVGWRRAQGLLECGARVVVVAPDAVEPLRDAAREGRLEWRRRPFAPEDAEGAFLVVAAADDGGANREAIAAARRAGALVNAAGEAEEGDVIVPLHRRRGRLTIAVSTGGAAPAAARRILERLDEALGDEYAIYLDVLDELRRRLKASPLDAGEKRRRLKRLAESDLPERIAEGMTREEAMERAWLLLEHEGDRGSD